MASYTEGIYAARPQGDAPASSNKFGKASKPTEATEPIVIPLFRDFDTSTVGLGPKVRRGEGCSCTSCTCA